MVWFHVSLFSSWDVFGIIWVLFVKMFSLSGKVLLGLCIQKAVSITVLTRVLCILVWCFVLERLLPSVFKKHPCRLFSIIFRFVSHKARNSDLHAGSIHCSLRLGQLQNSCDGSSPMSIFILWLRKWESEILHHGWSGRLCKVLNAFAVERTSSPLKLCSVN